LLVTLIKLALSQKTGPNGKHGEQILAISCIETGSFIFLFFSKDLFSEPAKSFTTIQTEGTIFLFGGYSDLVQEYTHRIWKYLPETHSWTIEGNMLVNRMNFASALGTC
jgi:hypothetical protein